MQQANLKPDAYTRNACIIACAGLAKDAASTEQGHAFTAPTHGNARIRCF